MNMKSLVLVAWNSYYVSFQYLCTLIFWSALRFGKCLLYVHQKGKKEILMSSDVVSRRRKSQLGSASVLIFFFQNLIMLMDPSEVSVNGFQLLLFSVFFV